MRTFYLATFLFLCQCGYNWGQGPRQLPGGHTTVYVEMFKNLSREVGAEANFTQALMNQLQRSGFAVVTSRGAAELILEGEILTVTDLDSGPINTFSSADHANNTSTSYRASLFTNYSMQVNVNLRAVRSRDKQAVWQTNITGAKNYRGSELTQQGIRSSNVLYNQSRRQQTMKLIAQEMMSEAFDRLTENF